MGVFRTLHNQPGAAGLDARHRRVDAFVQLLAVLHQQAVDQLVLRDGDGVLLSVLQWTVLADPLHPGQRMTQHALKHGVLPLLGCHLLDFDHKLHVGN